jgi:hypothetical protein
MWNSRSTSFRKKVTTAIQSTIGKVILKMKMSTFLRVLGVTFEQLEVTTTLSGHWRDYFGGEPRGRDVLTPLGTSNVVCLVLVLQNKKFRRA